MLDLENTNYNGAFVYFYSIVVLDKRRNIVEHYRWRDIPNRVYFKWFWYFKYRSALLQVKYPKYQIQTSWGVQTEISKRSEKEILKNKIIARKRKITEMQNKLDKARAEYNELFGFDDHPVVKKWVERQNKAKFELLSLENQFKELEQNENS